MSGLKDEPNVFKCLQGVGEIRRELMYFFVTVKAAESDYQVQSEPELRYRRRFKSRLRVLGYTGEFLYRTHCHAGSVLVVYSTAYTGVQSSVN